MILMKIFVNRIYKSQNNLFFDQKFSTWNQPSNFYVLYTTLIRNIFYNRALKFEYFIVS